MSSSADAEQLLLAILSLRWLLFGPHSTSGRDCSEPLWRWILNTVGFLAIWQVGPNPGRQLNQQPKKEILENLSMKKESLGQILISPLTTVKLKPYSAPSWCPKALSSTATTTRMILLLSLSTWLFQWPTKAERHNTRLPTVITPHIV